MMPEEKSHKIENNYLPIARREEIIENNMRSVSTRYNQCTALRTEGGRHESKTTTKQSNGRGRHKTRKTTTKQFTRIGRV